MADIDAELLALAGGDSSGDESMPSSPQRRSPSPKRSTKQPSPVDTSRKGVAQKARKVRRRKDYSDDDEESLASERSESINMSQSDSEAEFDPAEDKPIFPYEKLYYDAADKAEIQAKPEIEREEILAQRSEQVDRHEQDLTLRRLLAARAKENAKTEAKNKRKAAAAGLDDSNRKSSRQRTKIGGGRVGEASSAIEAYKQQRAEKSARDERRRNRPSAIRSSSENEFSDADAEAESDTGYDSRRYKRRSPTPPKDEPIAELVDIERARVGRDNFAQVCYTPNFEAAITDCYARVCLGPGRTPGVNEYRMCLIKGFASGKPYAITGSNGKPFLVDRYIVALHGKAQKAWSFLECSMSRFTEDEWRRYRIVMANEDCRLPTKVFVGDKLQQIGKLLNHKFSDLEISEKIKKQNNLMDTVNRTAEKKKIQAQIDDAVDAGDEAKVQELQDQLMNIVPVKLALNTTLHKQENHRVNHEAERLAELNRRNERMNAENVRKAQLAEMKAKKMKRKKPAIAAIKDDLFGSDSDFSRAGTPVNGALGTPEVSTPSGSQNIDTSSNGVSATATPSNGGFLLKVDANKPKKGLPVIKKTRRDDEILADMDLGIDIDI